MAANGTNIWTAASNSTTTSSKEGLRLLPLIDRKAMLGKLLAPVASGIELSEHIEADGATVFRYACKLGCEGIVSKRRASPYCSGRTKTWIKVKNPDSPAMTRVWER